MKRTLIILQILLLFSVVNGQDKGFLFSFGGAGYRMDDLKYYQEQMLATFPVEGKTVDSFSPYYSFSINFIKKIQPRLWIGAGYGNTSTGGRSNYTDYSGNVTTDMLAKSHRLGAFASYSVLNGERIDLALYGRLDANFTRVEVSSSIYVLGHSSLASNKYKSISPNASSGIELLYNFNAFSLGLDGGFLVDFPGDLEDSETGGKLLDPADNSQRLNSDWTGWRAGIKAIFWLQE